MFKNIGNLVHDMLFGTETENFNKGVEYAKETIAIEGNTPDTLGKLEALSGIADGFVESRKYKAFDKGIKHTLNEINK